MKQERKKYSTTVDIKMIDRLGEISEITRIPQSKLLDEAIECLWAKYEKKLDLYRK